MPFSNIIQGYEVVGSKLNADIVYLERKGITVVLPVWEAQNLGKLKPILFHIGKLCLPLLRQHGSRERLIKWVWCE
jgi:hypothetical protein